jgi:mannosyltransferase
MMNDKPNWLIKITPIVLIVLNLILKILFISSNSIGGDEPFSIYHAQMDLPSMIYHLKLGNNPPLFEIILHFWIKIFGISELSVRLPSLIFSVFTVYFIYRTGKDFFNYRIALFAGLLFTFSNYYLSLAHEARVYSLFAFLAALSMFAFLSLLKSKGGKSIHTASLIISNLLLIYSHYFGFFVIFVQIVLSISLYRQDRKLFQRLLLYQLIVFIFYIPYFPVIFERFLISSNEGTWVKPPGGILSIIDMIRNFNNEQFGQKTLFGHHPWLTLFYLGIVIASSARFIYKKGYKDLSVEYLYVFLSFLLPFIIMFLASFRIPMFLDRYLVFCVTGYYLSLAVCIEYLFENSTWKTALCILCLTGIIVTFNPNVDNKRHVRETVAKVRELKEKSTVVLICPKHFALNFAYYYDWEIFEDVDSRSVYDKVIERLKKEDIYSVSKIDEVDLNGVNRVIYLDAAAGFSSPGNNIFPTLENSYELVETHKFYEIFTVYEFLKNK